MTATGGGCVANFRGLAFFLFHLLAAARSPLPFIYYTDEWHGVSKWRPLDAASQPALQFVTRVSCSGALSIT